MMNKAQGTNTIKEMNKLEINKVEINKIEAIIFDMDGVLFDSERIIQKYWYELGEEMQIPRDKMDTLIHGTTGLNRTDTAIFFKKVLGDAVEYETFREIASGRFNQEIEKTGLPVLKGVYEILEYLQTTPIKVGLASSTRTEIVWKHLRSHNMEHYFQVVVCGDMIEHSKPEPDIYLKACEEIGVSPEKCMAIEDSPNGIISAHRAGMMPVMVPDQVQPTEELMKIIYGKFDSLLEVKAYLENKE